MLPVYIQIIDLLKKQKHIVVSEHVASERLSQIEARLTDDEIFNTDIGYIDECECLVADVTVPSVGVGYEICYAVSKDKPVLCIYREGSNVSAMVRGNSGVVSLSYRNIEDLEKTFIMHLK